MPLSAPDHAPGDALLALLPEARVGTVERLDPITLGLSGAAVYAVKASRGAFILRVQRRDLDESSFTQQLRVLRRAADAGIAPALVHVDVAARAVVSAQIAGVPMPAALGDPAQRGAVLASIVDRLRALHALDPSGVTERDPLENARAGWEVTRSRTGFPPWAATLGAALDGVAAALADDPRRVVSHNDLNPGNVLWDGARAWIVDWEVTGLGHPYYDLAALALFLVLDDAVALDLVAAHDGAPPDPRGRASFRALRRLAGILCGITFLGLVEDLRVLPAPKREDAPSLLDCYRAMRGGELDLRSPRGQASMGLALLKESVPESGP